MDKNILNVYRQEMRRGRTPLPITPHVSAAPSNPRRCVVAQIAAGGKVIHVKKEDLLNLR